MGEACLESRTCLPALLPKLESATVPPGNPCWYALKVRTGAETKAVDALRHRGFAPYCPLRNERRHYSDRMKIVQLAVFPGYIFCQFDVQHKLLIISSPGVEYIVGFADGPMPVPEKALMDVRRMIDAGANAIRFFARGERVRVTHGLLEGVEGVLIRDTTGDKLVVSIELLNQGASLHVSQNEVSPIGRN